MKKSTLLSFATAAAIVVTSAGTYAAWDQLSVSNEDTPSAVTMDKKVSMTLGTLDFKQPTERAVLSATEGNFDMVAQKATVNVDVKDVPTGATADYKLKTTAKVYEADKVTEATDVKVLAEPKSDALVGGETDTHEIDVTVTPNNVSAAGQTYYVVVTAEVAK